MSIGCEWSQKSVSAGGTQSSGFVNSAVSLYPARRMGQIPKSSHLEELLEIAGFVNVRYFRCSRGTAAGVWRNEAWAEQGFDK